MKNNESITKEQRVMRMMRQVLGSVVKDVTPAGGMPNPLSDETILNIKDCFALIAAREHELAQEAGMTLNEKPRFGGEGDTTVHAVPLSSIKTIKRK